MRHSLKHLTAVLLVSSVLTGPILGLETEPQDTRFEPALTWIKNNETYIDSLIIAQGDTILAEHYWNGFEAETLHEQQSATKSFSSALIGIAMGDGLIESLDQPLASLLPAYEGHLSGDKAKITLRHLLTMTSGLKWVDFGDGNSFQRITEAEDSIAFILDEPLVSEPGAEFFYNTGSSHLLSAIIHTITGQTTTEYAEDRLFGPLGITDVVWPKLRDGIAQGGWGMELRPRDMVKFGQLFLNEGRIGTQQIIPEAYVRDATRGHIATYYGSDYGFQFWIEHTMHTNPVAGARGYGGQDILILEDLDAVVTFTGNICCPKDMAEDVAYLMKTHISPVLENQR